MIVWDDRYMPPDNRVIFVVPFSHDLLEKNEGKWQINDDSDNDGVSDACSVESSDSDDNEETDTESSDDEDDDKVMRCTIRNRTMICTLFDSDGDIIQVRNLVYAVV